jgi:hypothetical protein
MAGCLPACLPGVEDGCVHAAWGAATEQKGAIVRLSLSLSRSLATNPMHLAAVSGSELWRPLVTVVENRIPPALRAAVLPTSRP